MTELDIKVAVFVAATAAIAWISRATLRDGRAHGFYRFWAWEAIVALSLLNVGYWFADPLCIRQLVSWFFLFASLPLIQQGSRLLHAKGRPDPRRGGDELLELEKTTRLVTDGVYGYIRHPFYGSLLFLTWGILLKHTGPAAIGLAAAATVLLYVTARIEETENIRFFGAPYRDYMARTKMFIPFVW